MNNLFIGLLETFFIKELQSHSYDGGKKKRIFEVYKQDKGILKQRIGPNLNPIQTVQLQLKINYNFGSTSANCYSS